MYLVLVCIMCICLKWCCSWFSMVLVSDGVVMLVMNVVWLLGRLCGGCLVMFLVLCV